MSTEDLIRAWKDPDSRSDHPDLEHPAGAMELAHPDPHGGAAASSLPCVTAVTVAISCHLTCDSTVQDGSCNAFSVGCCPEVGPTPTP